MYFGNWLRDYSQALDINSLSKLSADTLILIVAVLGFMTFGFATDEFQVTADRLGVYLPVEHIDNPKGYAVGDPRKTHYKLRPPVDDRELEIDERTGMKNYMATEDEEWDSSTAFIRRTFYACIEHGRLARGRRGPDLWEAYRLLGTGLHTMEDLLAHSNWCEVALRKLGYDEVFCHVGDNVFVNTPNGLAPPLVTGTFGGADFVHSLMGEATDRLSQASVTDLAQKMDEASENDRESIIERLKMLLEKLPFGVSDKVSEAEEMSEQSEAYHFDPDNIAPPEVQRKLYSMLRWRDGIYKEVDRMIESIPGLSSVLDDIGNALNAFVYNVISPYVMPMLKDATSVLDEGSKAVIDSIEEQFEVFDNPEASDPTHSFLSKDHFDLILNEPAGKIAQLVVEHTVNLIVQAWSDESDPNQVIDNILEAFHHPYYATGHSEIQHQMFNHIDEWIGGMGHEGAQGIIQRLTKDAVRSGRNKRPGSEDELHDEVGYGGHTCGSMTQESFRSEDQTNEFERVDEYGSIDQESKELEAADDYEQSGSSEGGDEPPPSEQEYPSENEAVAEDKSPEQAEESHEVSEEHNGGADEEPVYEEEEFRSGYTPSYSLHYDVDRFRNGYAPS